MKFKKSTAMHIVAAAIGCVAVLGAWTAIKTNAGSVERISYTEYQNLLDNGKIDIVYYDDTSEYMTIALSSSTTASLTEKEKEKYEYSKSEQKEVLYPDGEDFKKDLLEQGVIVREKKKPVFYYFNNCGNLFFSIMSLAVIIYFFSKMSSASNSNFAQTTTPDEISVTFSDVIGHEEIKGDLQLLVKQLKSGVKAKDLSHGVLFEGGAGTGKTMLAKAIASEAGVNFISVNSSNLIEMYVGVGAKRVREAFDKAREAAPCVLFFDEIDAVGAERGSQRSNRENDQTINALLTELDGFADKGDVLVIAATNRADNLDKALLRSGRFDRQIKVDAPKRWETRQELFEHYLKDRKDETVNTEVLAKQTVGFSGADIAAVSREANLIAFREDAELLSHAFLEEAIDKMVFKGNRSNDDQHKEDLEIVAYHEAGHAVMTFLLGRQISRISILGMTSGVGGAVFQTDTERVFETKKQVEEQIMIAYAGRAAEEIKNGKDNVTLGASNDITQATKLLFAYVTKYGFDSKTGLVDVEMLSEAMPVQNNAVTERISELSAQFYADAVSKLSEAQCLVTSLAEHLLEVKTMSGEETVDFFKEGNNKCL